MEQTSKLYLSTQKFISNMILPCKSIKHAENQKDNANNLGVCSLVDTNCNFTNEVEHAKDNIDLIWENMRLPDENVSRLRTWESFGSAESSKQMLFVTDLPETMLHLARIRQTSILSLLPKKVKTATFVQMYHAKIPLFVLQAMAAVQLMREVPLKKFLSDVEMLFFGIDSDSFTYDNVVRI